MRHADLLIVMGTSLTVHPFASLASRVDETCPRVLINIECVGDFGHKKRDVVLLGKCDEIIGELCAELGWGEELGKAWASTAGAVEAAVAGVTIEEKNEEKKNEEKRESEEEKNLKREVDFLTAAIQTRLDLQEKMKAEEETQVDVTERDTDRGPILDISSEPSRQTPPFLDKSETDQEPETSTSASNPNAKAASEKEDVDNVGKL
jgi:NAD-dependent histone deacetylase SIR2